MAPEKIKRHDIKFNIYSRIAVSFVVLTAALLGVIIYFSIGKAVISITPEIRRTDAELVIPIGPGVPTNPEERVLAGAIESIEVEAMETILATEVREIPAKAHGTVSLINTSGRAQPLVATTRLLTPENVLFRIQKTVTVPARGRIDVEAIADKSGKEGEIAATTFIIPGLPPSRQREVYAESAVPMTGGATKDLAITDEDITAAKQNIEKKLKEAALEKLNATAGAVAFQPYSLTLTNTTESHEDFRNDGGETPQVGMTVHLKTQATAARFDERQLFELLRNSIARAIPQFHKVYQLDYRTVTVTIVEIHPDGSGVVKATIGAWSILDSETPSLNPERFVSVTSDDIHAALAALPDIKEVNVRLFPLWAKRTPQFKENIEVRIEEPQLIKTELPQP